MTKTCRAIARFELGTGTTTGVRLRAVDVEGFAGADDGDVDGAAGVDEADVAGVIFAAPGVAGGDALHEASRSAPRISAGRVVRRPW